MSMCLVLQWKEGLFAIAVIALLSQKKSVALTCSWWKLNGNLLNQTTWQAYEVAINFAFDIDNAITSCFLELQKNYSKTKFE